MPRTDAPAAVTASITAMASPVNIRAEVGDAEGDETRAAVADALTIFHDVDRTCTRFSSSSDLMRANSAGNEWVTVHRRCFDALVEAYAAYRRTDGRFDPRVLDDLVRLGYAVSWLRQLPQPRDAGSPSRRAQLEPWQPHFRGETTQVRIGPRPVDLGGIGKGLAIRWAADRLHDSGVTSFLVEAGGDVVCAGAPAEAAAWRVSVEDPRGGADPVAVLEVGDEAVATSSVRLRSWRVGGTDVHHLIDPRTGMPGGAGLIAVTVVDDDPARAEVWSKVLFLTGRMGIAATADLFNLPALWVDTDGVLGVSAGVGSRLIWRAA